MRYYTKSNVYFMLGVAIASFFIIFGIFLLYNSESKSDTKFSIGIGMIGMGFAIIAIHHSVATEAKVEHIIKLLIKNNQFDYESIKKKDMPKSPKESRQDRIVAILLIVMVIISIASTLVFVNGYNTNNHMIKEFQERYPTPLDAYNAYHNGTLTKNEIPKELFPIIQNFKP